MLEKIKKVLVLLTISSSLLVFATKTVSEKVIFMATPADVVASGATNVVTTTTNRFGRVWIRGTMFAEMPDDYNPPSYPGVSVMFTDARDIYWDSATGRFIVPNLGYWIVP